MTAAPGPIAVVTAAVARDLDEDLPPLLEAAGAVDLTVSVVDWHDDAVDWAGFELALVRSTWDYSDRRREFLDWAQRVDGLTRLVNPAPVLAWNTDKAYLAQLAAEGVAVVPTLVIRPGDDDPADLDWPAGEVVVKPAVSAGSRDTARYAAARRGRAVDHARSLLDADRAVVVQPYLGSVDHRGETALILLGGEYSHSICKGPLLREGDAPSRALFAPEHITARAAAPDELDAGRAVLDAMGRLAPLAGVRFPLAYVRVDLVRDDDGRPLVLEVEATEPSLFFEHQPAAAGRLLDAARRAGVDPSAAGVDPLPGGAISRPGPSGGGR